MTAARQVRPARIDDVPSLYDGLIKLLRAGVQITAFGANVLDLPPSYETSAHDESDTGQEELYVRLAGAGELVVRDPDERALPLGEGDLVAVAPGCSRTLRSGPEGLRVLVVGGVPGKPYVAPEWTQAGTSTPG